jgi:uncharacterized OB-fold protein
VKPSPRLTPINQPFLDGCNRDELWLQQCPEPTCRKSVFYPRVGCPHCGGTALTWVRASGRGRIVSVSRIHRPQHESFFAEAPYYFIAVRLDEGPLMFSRLRHEGPVPESGLIGQSVRAVFVQQTPAQRLPFFEL